MKLKAIGLLIGGIAYLFVYGLLFGSHLGVMGDWVHLWGLGLKTKIINSLAIFGFLMLGEWTVRAVRRESKPVSLAVGAFLAWGALTLGFVFQDCAIYKFCERGIAINCTPAYDKQGAHAECQ